VSLGSNPFPLKLSLEARMVVLTDGRCQGAAGNFLGPWFMTVAEFNVGLRIWPRLCEEEGRHHFNSPDGGSTTSDSEPVTYFLIWETGVFTCICGPLAGLYKVKSKGPWRGAGRGGAG
jgi:hypothetical protein